MTFGNVIVIDEINTLSVVLENYDDIVKGKAPNFKSNNAEFCEKFGRIINELVKK